MLGYYLVPHPPIIVPSVGNGEEKKIQDTTDAYLRLAKEIADYNPETIITITPHGPLFSDAISLSLENEINGDMSQFNASDVRFNQTIDTYLTENIHTLSNNAGISTVTLTKDILMQYGRDFELDHGTMVPLYFINQFYQDYNIVHITYGMLSDIDLYRFGTKIKDAVLKLNRKAVIIASGDLSHRLTHNGPYPYSKNGKVFDDKFISLLKEGKVKDIFVMDKKLIEEAGECGFRSILILLGSIEGSFKGELLSYEGTFGVGYALMKFNTTGDKLNVLDDIIHERKIEIKTKRENSDEYVKLARRSLEYYLKNNKRLKLDKDLPDELLNDRAGVFVSLKKHGELRGCMGTFLPTTKSLALEIIGNSVEAAVSDPRFNPVSYDELDDIEVSVDVLTNPVDAIIDELDPKKFGVIVSKGIKKGLLLPDLEGVDTIEKQLSITCQKAGINPSSSYTIQKFSVIRHQEGRM